MEEDTFFGLYTFTIGILSLNLSNFIPCENSSYCLRRMLTVLLIFKECIFIPGAASTLLFVLVEWNYNKIMK